MRTMYTKRWMLRLTTAVALTMAVAGCASGPPAGPQPAIDPGSSEQRKQAALLLRYCNKMWDSGDLYIAASMCQRSFDTDPTNSAPLFPLAKIYRQLGAIEQAANAYRAAILINPSDVEALYGLAKATMDQGNYDMAMAQLERALQLDDDDPRIYNAMGIIKDQQGEHKTAQALYRTGLLIDDDNVSLRNNLGLSLALTGDQSESIAMLREVAREPKAGPIGSRNLALAAQYQAPPEAMAESDDGDGPIEIRNAAPDGEEGEKKEYADGDQMAAAMSKPLHKQPGKPSRGQPIMADGKKPMDVKPQDRKIGSASRPMKSAGGAEQEAAARLPAEFLRDDALPAPEAAKPAKPTRKAAKSATGGSYAVQVGAYKSKKRAERRWESILKTAKDVLGDLPREVVEGEAGDGKTVYRLRTGPLPDRAAGDKLCAELSNLGFGCFVVTVPKDKTAAMPKKGMADTEATAKPASETPEPMAKPAGETPEAKAADPAGNKTAKSSAKG